MLKTPAIRRARLRQAAAELPDPDAYPHDRFEARIAESGEDAGVSVEFVRTTSSGVARRALWVFEGLLNVEAFERTQHAPADKRYQQPKAEKHDLSDWLRSELGPRCETLKLGEYEALSAGQRVRCYFR